MGTKVTICGVICFLLVQIIGFTWFMASTYPQVRDDLAQKADYSYEQFLVWSFVAYMNMYYVIFGSLGAVGVVKGYEFARLRAEVLKRTGGAFDFTNQLGEVTQIGLENNKIIVSFKVDGIFHRAIISPSKLAEIKAISEVPELVIQPEMDQAGSTFSPGQWRSGVVSIISGGKLGPDGNIVGGKKVGTGWRFNNLLITAWHVAVHAASMAGETFLVEPNNNKSYMLTRKEKKSIVSKDLDFIAIHVPEQAWSSLGVKTLKLASPKNKTIVNAPVMIDGKTGYTDGRLIPAREPSMLMRFWHNASTSKGDSGMPLEDRDGKVVAMHIGNNSHFNVALDVFSILVYPYVHDSLSSRVSNKFAQVSKLIVETTSPTTEEQLARNREFESRDEDDPHDRQQTEFEQRIQARLDRLDDNMRDIIESHDKANVWKHEKMDFKALADMNDRSDLWVDEVDDVVSDTDPYWGKRGMFSSGTLKKFQKETISSDIRDMGLAQAIKELAFNMCGLAESQKKLTSQVAIITEVMPKSQPSSPKSSASSYETMNLLEIASSKPFVSETVDVEPRNLRVSELLKSLGPTHTSGDTNGMNLKKNVLLKKPDLVSSSSELVLSQTVDNTFPLELNQDTKRKRKKKLKNLENSNGPLMEPSVN